MDCYGFCKSEFRILNFGLFRCLDPRLLFSGLIAFRVLINSRLSMDSMENGHFWGYVLMLMICINCRFLIVNQRTFLYVGLINYWVSGVRVGLVFSYYGYVFRTLDILWVLFYRYSS